ncbi:helix-turn-helix domain-containing protein [Mycobacterium sp. D16Q16]|uniref:helix-turn-helix domain-containing protein n=1 Tax=Mycobacterium sp. D16Q16 TaxID=1855659 RepID=UPI0015902B83|nr:helix-turn-helix domain-containing protein [Mycobacterium sp. D16Q16]
MTQPDNHKFSKLEWLKRTNGHKFTISEFRVLLSIFNHSDKTGQESFPGSERIAEEACITRTTASEAVRSLIERGWIREVEKGSGYARKYSRYALVPDAPHPHSSSTADVHSSAGDDLHMSALADTNQILVSDHGTDPLELRVQDPKHEEILVGGSPEGHHLPVEVEVLKPAAPSGKDDPWGIPSLLSGPKYGSDEWKADQLASAIPWPSNKPLPKPGDPDWDTWALYKDETTGQLITIQRNN